MRVLVATTAGAGHFGPIVPFALACAAAGHEVRVAAPLSLGTVVAQTGLECVPLADPSEAELASVFPALPTLSLEESNATVIARGVRRSRRQSRPSRHGRNRPRLAT